MKAVIYANDFKQVNACTKYAEEKGYQIIALKNKDHDIIGENEMDILLVAVAPAKDRTFEEIAFMEKVQSWYEIELVVVK